MGFVSLEFELNNNITIKHKFEVDTTICSNNSQYDIIIGSNIYCKYECISYISPKKFKVSMKRKLHHHFDNKIDQIQIEPSFIPTKDFPFC